MFDHIEILDQPDQEPVTLAQAKAQGRNIADEEDALFQQKLIAARQRGEAFTKRSFCTQTLDVWYSAPSGIGYFDLPRGHVQSVLGVFTYDIYGVETIIDESLYNLMANQLIMNDWFTSYRPLLGIKIRIVSGYGDPADVPEILKEGILEYAYHLYEHRMGEPAAADFEVQAKGGAGLPQGVYDKWKPYQLIMV